MLEINLAGSGGDRVFPVKTVKGGLFRLISLKPRRYNLMTRGEIRGFFAGVARSPVNTADAASVKCRRNSLPAAALRVPKILVFRSLLNAELEDSSCIHQASWFLASALKAGGARVVFSDLKLTLSGEDFERGEELSGLLRENADISFAALTLSESYFRGAEKLARFIKKKLPACRIAVGGIMPSRYPFNVLANLPSADILVRGDGENIFPEAVSILCGSAPVEVVEQKLMGLNGFAYRDSSRIVLSRIDASNAERELDGSRLDFGMLTRRDVAGGGTLYLSRGCMNACSFCVSLNKGGYRAVSTVKAKEWLAAYKERVLELFGSEAGAPARSFGLGFYDDDFFVDKEWALEILGFMKGSGLFVGFLQAAVKSFFRKGRLNQDFLKRLDSSVFRSREVPDKKKTDIFIGTENFSGSELKRLGKGYGYREIKRVAEALSAKKIRQSHHFIMCNAFTRAVDLRKNIAALTALNKTCSPYFDILRPGRLFSFFGTPSYRRAVAAGLSGFINVKDVLSVRGFPEYDYPLVGGDSPAEREADAMLRAVPSRLPSIK
ncbi:MAG: hypothetical protein A2234_11290 [Elusimicrobia bacterium RIFOXYA2_FULL_58_8]|nr:MAG: hypothetical protein A2285_02860 [Elusimicrobia bacterium RIFOXYA12_FULL_57_11]OGS14523.1 MAG: hypothetical protein A2234_11290 [Elusimicrobia bacterium RIFOXYA2_FULL_58_8]